MAINHGVLSEKGNGKDRAKSTPKLIREFLWWWFHEGALIDGSFFAGFKPGGDNYKGQCPHLLNAGCFPPLCFGGEYY